MTRRLLYQVAMSVDGYIAGPNGEHDWITMDPSIDFMAQCSQFDTAIMGRVTYAKAMAIGCSAVHDSPGNCWKPDSSTASISRSCQSCWDRAPDYSILR